MNYPFRVAILRYAADGNAETLRQTVESIVENYPKPALDCMMNNLGTHDTSRLLTRLTGVERPASLEEQANCTFTPEQREQALSLARPATVLQFTLSGVPCIYYGDEAGLDGFGDPFCRKCYPWGHEDTALLHWYRDLIRIRRATSAYAGGTYRTLRADNGVFAFERSAPGSRAVTVVNMGAETEYPLPDSGELLLSYHCERTEKWLILKKHGCAVIRCGT